MSYRAAASLLLGTVTIIAAIAATASGIAGSGQHPPGTSSGPSETGVAGGSTSGPQVCEVVNRVVRLRVIRTDAFPQNGFTFSFPATVTVRSRAAVREVARDLCALPTVPPGEVFHCPADFGIVYHLHFTLETGRSARPVTVDATGCQFVRGAGPGTRRVSTARSFWATLGRAMGLAHPTNATFRGSAGSPA